jgi:hypothetical protein
MSNRQFWSFLDLEFIYNTKFAKLFYKIAAEFNDNAKLEYIKFMDYAKFFQFVAIFTKTSTLDNVSIKDLRMRFIYNLFDTDGSDEVNRLEFRNIITSFTEMILVCKFDSEGINERIKNLNVEATNLNLIERVLDMYVDEVFNQHSYTGEYLTYEEWQKWLFSINGADKIIEFVGEFK